MKFFEKKNYNKHFHLKIIMEKFSNKTKKEKNILPCGITQGKILKNYVLWFPCVITLCLPCEIYIVVKN